MEPSKENSVNTKRCPFCLEEIHLEAIVCKHCNRILSDRANLIPTGRGFILQYAPENSITPFILLTLKFEYGSLAAGIISFILSFFLTQYFWQFLVAFTGFMFLFLFFRIRREVLFDLIAAISHGDKKLEEQVLNKLRRRFKK